MSHAAQPQPPAQSPTAAFRLSTGFTLLSWQDPIATGALAVVVFGALWAVGIAELTWAQVLLYTAVGAVSAGGLLSLANAFTSEGQRLARWRIHDETMVADATAFVAGGVSSALHRVQEAVDWTHAGSSAVTLAALWTAARWAPWGTTATITLTALAAFSLPAVAVLYRPHIMAVWSDKVSPALAPALAGLTGVVSKVQGAYDAGGSSRQLVLAGTAFVGLLVLYFVIVYFELVNLLDVVAATALAVAALQSHKAKRA